MNVFVLADSYNMQAVNFLAPFSTCIHACYLKQCSIISHEIFWVLKQLFVYFFLLGWLVGWFKRWTRTTQWAVSDGLGFIPKNGPETCHHNFDLPRRGWLPRFGTPRGIIRMGIGRTLHRRRILRASGAISVHGGVSPGEPRTQALRFGAEGSFNLPTAGPEK